MKDFKTLFTIIITLIVLSATAQNDITGKITYHNDNETPLSGVELHLLDSDSNPISSTFTDENGDYLFENVANGTYHIIPSYNAEAGGVDMGDALLINFYLNGQYEFTPIEFLAADVTGDGDVTREDFKFIVVNHLAHGEPMPAGDWVFEDITVNVGAKEGGDDDDDDGGSRLGSSTGDVAGSWEPGQRNLPLIESHYKYYSLLPNTLTKLNVFAESNIDINAAGLVINYPTDFIRIESVETSIPNAKTYVGENQIRLAWVSEGKIPLSLIKGDNILTIEAELINSTEETIHFNLAQESHFANAEGMLVKAASLTMPSVKENKQLIDIISVAPNPVVTSANVNFYLSKGAKVNMQLIDLSGRVVQTFANSNFSDGRHTQILRKTQAIEPGIYMLQINMNEGEFIQSRKLIVR